MLVIIIMIIMIWNNKNDNNYNYSDNNSNNINANYDNIYDKYSENIIIKVQISKQGGFKFLLVLKRTKLFFHLKGVFAKNERGYRLTAIKKRFWSLLILLLSVASIRRKFLKTSHTE